MAGRRTTHRRDFLKGRSAAGAIQDLVADRLAPECAPSRADEPVVASSAEQPYLLRFGRRAMACEFEVIVNAGQYPEAADHALAALDLVDELESQLTVYRDTSEISDINRRAHREPVVVESRLFALLEQALALHQATCGAYDVAAGSLVKVWGFYRRQGAVPTADALRAALACAGSNYLALDPVDCSVRFQRPDVELNLGAIGKGYALDRVAELLHAAGICDFLLHGGQSSILAHGGEGADRAQGWSIGLRDPLRPGRRLAELRVHDRAIGTSGAAVQFFRHEGRRYGHILDPRTGWPAEGVLTATAIAPSAAEADALATAFYVLGGDAALDYCARHPEIGVVIVGGSEATGATGVRHAGLTADEFQLVDDQPAIGEGLTPS
jgi:thiamine biosynthesis lipoprotein